MQCGATNSADVSPLLLVAQDSCSSTVNTENATIDDGGRRNINIG
ncbi:MAG: hypothetical protein A07HR60_02688 [uncultured archaeon A07HR60]|nr:MAG: hypothetical protein A07HR60_02688 [uncultured archaeon A07HR60]